MSISEDVSRLHDLSHLSHDRQQFICVVDKDISLSDLADGLSELLHNDNDESLESQSSLVLPSAENNINNAEKEEDTCSNRYNTDFATVISGEYLSISSTMPSSDEITSTRSLDRKNEGEGEDEFVELTDSVLKENDYESMETSYNPIPLPNPLKIVSAMKGSREKRGTPLKEKLTVKWDPDVYDPPPSAASHVVTNKKQRYRSDSKKSKRNKQKGAAGGKPSKGSKDKKQVRKYGGGSSNTSSRCYRTTNTEDDYRVVLQDEPFVGLGDFEVGGSSPESSYCGSSFLKKSTTKMHLSVAEAT